MHNILNKKIINKLYNDKYNDILLRGKYFVIYCNKYYINFLKNYEIQINDNNEYIPPTGVDFINNILKYLNIL